MRSTRSKDEVSAVSDLWQQEPREEVVGQMIDAERALKALRRSRGHVVALSARIESKGVELRGTEGRSEGVDRIEIAEIKRSSFNALGRYAVARAGDDPVASFNQPSGGVFTNARAGARHHNDFHWFPFDLFMCVHQPAVAAVRFIERVQSTAQQFSCASAVLTI